MKKVLAIFGAAAAVLLSPVLGGAQASAVPPGCSADRLCLFIDSNYGNYDGGGPGQLYGTNGQFSLFSRPACVPPHATNGANGTWNDCVSSLWNSRTSGQYRLYQHASWGGQNFTIAANSGMTSMPTVNGYNMNDQISSDTRL